MYNGKIKEEVLIGRVLLALSPGVNCVEVINFD